MDISGKVKVIFDMQQFDSGFTKREFVITTEEQYPQDVKFELVKDKTALIDQYQVGSNVRVHFNLRGNEWQGKYFVNLQAWKLDAVGAAQQSSPGAPPEAAPMPAVAPVDLNSDDDDDLPF